MRLQVAPGRMWRTETGNVFKNQRDHHVQVEGARVLSKSEQALYEQGWATKKTVTLGTGRLVFDGGLVGDVGKLTVDIESQPDRFEMHIDFPHRAGKTESMRQHIAAALGVSRDTLMLNALYGTFADGGAVDPRKAYAGRLQELWFPGVRTADPAHRQAKAALNSDLGITPFVEPDYPSVGDPEPEAPVDTPSAAALRPLLADRERIRQNATDQVAGHDRHIADLEAQVAALKVDRQHKTEIINKVSTEIIKIEDDIRILNGGAISTHAA